MSLEDFNLNNSGELLKILSSGKLLDFSRRILPCIKIASYARERGKKKIAEITARQIPEPKRSELIKRQTMIVYLADYRLIRVFYELTKAACGQQEAERLVDYYFLQQDPPSCPSDKPARELVADMHSIAFDCIRDGRTERQYVQLLRFIHSLGGKPRWCGDNL